MLLFILMEADSGGGGRGAWRDDTKGCALALPAATGKGTKGRSRPSHEQVAARGTAGAWAGVEHSDQWWWWCQEQLVAVRLDN